MKEVIVEEKVEQTNKESINNTMPIEEGTDKYDNITKEIQEYYVGVPYSWEYIENSKSWFIIETSKNYKYYFNKKTNEKTWECPEELEQILKELNKENEESEEQKGENKENEENFNVEGNNESLDDILEGYKQLIIEKKINEFAKYESVLVHLLYDHRYLKVPKELRKEQFYKLLKEASSGKKAELKILSESLQKFLHEKEYKFVYPYKESEVLKILKKRKEYIGNTYMNQSEEWKQAREKIVKNFIEGKKNEKKKKIKYKLEEDLRESLKNEDPKDWPFIKNKIRKKQKYELLSYEEIDILYEKVKDELLKQKKRKLEKGPLETYVKRKKELDTSRTNKNEENMFLQILSEKLKYPVIEKDLLKFHNYGSKESFEKLVKIPDSIVHYEKYQKLSLSNQEKFDLYKIFIQKYINEKLDVFNKKLHELSINCINNSFEEIVKMIDKDQRLFKSLTSEHLMKNFNQWRDQSINEAKNIFKNYLLRCTFIKHNSDEEGLYAQLINFLSNEVSYNRLACIPEERDQIIRDRIKELKKEHNKNKNLSEKLHFD